VENFEFSPTVGCQQQVDVLPKVGMQNVSHFLVHFDRRWSRWTARGDYGVTCGGDSGVDDG
jgi:hypothetical protein